MLVKHCWMENMLRHLYKHSMPLQNAHVLVSAANVSDMISAVMSLTLNELHWTGSHKPMARLGFHSLGAAWRANYQLKLNRSEMSCWQVLIGQITSPISPHCINWDKILKHSFCQPQNGKQKCFPRIERKNITLGVFVTESMINIWLREWYPATFPAM